MTDVADFSLVSIFMIRTKQVAITKITGQIIFSRLLGKTGKIIQLFAKQTKKTTTDAFNVFDKIRTSYCLLTTMRRKLTQQFAFISRVTEGHGPPTVLFYMDYCYSKLRHCLWSRTIYKSHKLFLLVFCIIIGFSVKEKFFFLHFFERRNNR